MLMGMYIIPVRVMHPTEKEVSPSTESGRLKTKKDILVSAAFRSRGGGAGIDVAEMWRAGCCLCEPIKTA